jgi:hypothetical protein
MKKKMTLRGMFCLEDTKCRTVFQRRLFFEFLLFLIFQKKLINQNRYRQVPDSSRLFKMTMHHRQRLKSILASDPRTD